jgi:hypothetical protein
MNNFFSYNQFMIIVIIKILIKNQHILIKSINLQKEWLYNIIKIKAYLVNRNGYWNKINKIIKERFNNNKKNKKIELFMFIPKL